MNIHPRRRKPWLYPVLIVAALAVLGASFLIYRHFHSDIQVVSDGPTAAQIKQQSELDAEKKKDYTSDPKNTPTEDTPPSTEPTESTNLQLTARQETNGTVTIIAKLPGVSAGSCALKVTNGSKTTNKTADIVYQPEFSTCAGFSISVADLGTGTWKAALSIVGSNSGEATTTLEVK